MGLSNLPPGVTESMIPGNRPEDGEMPCRECGEPVEFEAECECGEIAPDYWSEIQEREDAAAEDAYERAQQMEWEG